MKKTPKTIRRVNDWEPISFKVRVEMKKKIEADMEVTDSPDMAEYFRFLLRQRFERTK